MIIRSFEIHINKSITIAFLLVISVFVIPVMSPGNVVDAQEGGAITIKVKDGYKESIPADGQSYTVLVVELDFDGLGWSRSGKFYMETSATYGWVSSESRPSFPAEITYDAPKPESINYEELPLNDVVEATIYYCPPSAEHHGYECVDRSSGEEESWEPASVIGTKIIGLTAIPETFVGGDVRMSVKKGYPESVPADGKSSTVLVIDFDTNAPCWKESVDKEYGAFWMEVTASLGTVTPSSEAPERYPTEITLNADKNHGQAEVKVTISYCPPDAVGVFGVCTDPNAYWTYGVCEGGIIIEMTEVVGEAEEEEDEDFGVGLGCEPKSPAINQQVVCSAQVTGARDDESLEYVWYLDSAPGVKTLIPSWTWDKAKGGAHDIMVEVYGDNRSDKDILTLQVGETVEATSSTSDTEVADLVRDLEQFLSLAGVKDLDPAKVAAGGAATSVLLAVWVIMNHQSGVTMDAIEEALRRWRWGDAAVPEKRADERIVGGDKDHRKVPEGEKIPLSRQKPKSVPEAGIILSAQQPSPPPVGLEEAVAVAPQPDAVKRDRAPTPVDQRPPSPEVDKRVQPEKPPEVVAWEDAAKGEVDIENPPEKIRIPKEVCDAGDRAWARSFPEGRSQEHGACIVRTDKGFKAINPKAGDAHSCEVDYPTVGECIVKGYDVVGSIHTHPYPESEGGHTNVGPSDGDFEFFIEKSVTENVMTIQAGPQERWVMVRTKQTPTDWTEGVTGNEIKATFNRSFNHPKNRDLPFTQRVQRAAIDTANKYNIKLYNGRGNTLELVNR